MKDIVPNATNTVSRISRIWIFASGTMLLPVGCDSSSKPILPSNTMAVHAPTATSDDSGAFITHPEYANWSQFPVGAQVTRYRVVSNAHGEVEVTTVVSLTEKTDNHVVVTTQVNVQRSGEPLEENPPESTRFVARFQRPSGLSEDYFQLPSGKAKKVGEQSLDIHGKTVLAEIFEWTESNETGPMSVKLWRSSEVPGRMVRQEMLIEASQTKTIEELRSVSWDGEPIH